MASCGRDGDARCRAVERGTAEVRPCDDGRQRGHNGGRLLLRSGAAHLSHRHSHSRHWPRRRGFVDRPAALQKLTYQARLGLVRGSWTKFTDMGCSVLVETRGRSFQ